MVYILTTSPASGHGVLIVRDAVAVSKFSDIVRVDSSVSKPEGEVVVIPALFNEL